MRIYPIRSALFMMSFLIVVGITCVICLPTLILPRKSYLWVVTFFCNSVYVLEKTILGLDFEVRGVENVPNDGSPYIVAAKHQSAYETFKLRLLFEDPAIILKKELFKIPLWGWYLKKSDVIAIDRSTPESAINSMVDGARRMKAQNRPIVLFPQGTRVTIDQTSHDKPYKAGIVRIQNATELSIIPMATNSGYFWPRNSWLKKPGTVIFEFLPALPVGLDKKELMTRLEHDLETTSNALVAKARPGADSYDEPRRGFPIWRIVLVLLLAIAYSAAWFYAADFARAQYLKFMDELIEDNRPVTAPVISGFPGPITMRVSEEYIQSNQGMLRVHDLEAKAWPLPFLPIHVKTGPVEVHSYKWRSPLDFESFEASLGIRGGKILDVHSSALKRSDFEAGAKGTIDFNQEPVPKFDMTIELKNHPAFMQVLIDKGIMEERAAMFGSAALSMFMKDDVVSVPITQSGNTLYAGPLPVLTLPTASGPTPVNPAVPQDNPPALSQ